MNAFLRSSSVLNDSVSFHIREQKGLTAKTNESLYLTRLFDYYLNYGALDRGCFLRPLSMEGTFFVHPLIGVSAKVVALSLGQILG
ncbi:hypothetical protein Lepto7375DRAFT_7611 [Leptolyngbya sp. PCC 7375]|nr:hypothetical protein Lepto7375DRAFT_7611 [Leptolyngbya sp. PCC 7375]